MARKRNLVQAVGYVRTSSATNVGADKDSEKRQRAAIERFAKAGGYQLVEWFNDPAVSGADPIESRPGFAALLDRVENNGVRVVLVEDASRFARDLIAQELGVLMLIKRGMKVITASGDDLTDATDPSRIMMRQIAGSFASTRSAVWYANCAKLANDPANSAAANHMAKPCRRRWRWPNSCTPMVCPTEKSQPSWPLAVT